jgi:hypothetical protein
VIADPAAQRWLGAAVIAVGDGLLGRLVSGIGSGGGLAIVQQVPGWAGNGQAVEPFGVCVFQWDAVRRIAHGIIAELDRRPETRPHG